MDQQRTPGAGDDYQGGQQKPTPIGGAAAGDATQKHGPGGDTVERVKDKARSLGEQARAAIGEENVERAKTMARNLGEQARAVVSDENVERAKTIAREQGARAGEYVTRNLHENPYAALLIAGAIGYGVAYLIHSRS